MTPIYEEEWNERFTRRMQRSPAKTAVFARSSATGLAVPYLDVRPEMADEFQESQPAESTPPTGMSQISCHRTARDASKTKDLSVRAISDIPAAAFPPSSRRILWVLTDSLIAPLSCCLATLDFVRDRTRR
jgi:hypothetical protein